MASSTLPGTAACPSIPSFRRKARLSAPIRQPSRISLQLAAAGGASPVLERGVAPSRPVGDLTDEGGVLRGPKAQLLHGSQEALSELTTVEVKFQMAYKTSFGQHLFITGNSPSLGNWDVKNAVMMSWNEGHIWSAVLKLPAGSRLEYKYVVGDQLCSAATWQQGPNYELKVTSPGGLLEVDDAWGHERRVRRELGMPAAAAADQHGVKAPCAVANGLAVAASGQQQVGDDIVWEQQWERSGFARGVVEVINLPEASVTSLEGPPLDSPFDFFSAAAAGSGTGPASPTTPEVGALAVEVGPGPMTDVAVMLPGIEDELLSALEQLADSRQVDAAAQRTLMDGLAVLANLQQQHKAMLDLLVAKTNTSSQGTAGSMAQAAPGGGSNAEVKPLKSHDDLACALLSDDCAEACNCMVDALCSCHGEEADLHQHSSSNLDQEHHHNHDNHHQQEVLGSEATPTSSSPRLAQQQQEEVAAGQLVAALAAQAEPLPEFTDVGEVMAAINRSLELLEALKDPAHPHMLEADRGLARAHRGTDVVRLGSRRNVAGTLWGTAAHTRPM